MGRPDADHHDVPRRTPGADATRQPLTPTEGYLLSQIDGKTSTSDLEMITGVPADEFDAALERLRTLGLVESGPTSLAARGSARPAILPDRLPTGSLPEGMPPWPAPDAAEATEEKARPSGATAPPPKSGGSDADGRPDRAERRSHSPLTDEETTRVDAFLVRCEAADFYALLGASRRASRAQIRSAYFGLAKRYHPDAFYGRILGNAQGKLERIFRQITRAFEVLSRAEQRRQYDEYLRGIAVVGGHEVEEQAWEEEKRRRQESAPAPEPAEAEAPGAAEAAEAASVGESGAPGAPLSSAAERSIQARPAAPTEAPEAEPGDPGTRPAVEPRTGPRGADAWRRKRVARQLAAVLGAGRRAAAAERRGRDYLADAEAAAKQDEWGRVYGLLEAAERLGLEGEERKRAEELRAAAGEQLARITVSQARFAESAGDLGAALRHAELACKYGPAVPDHWDLRARLLLRMGRELHRARDAAMRAIQLAPRVVGYRLTMTRVYLAAGLAKNARREAEAALEIDPGDREARALLAEAKTAS